MKFLTHISIFTLRAFALETSTESIQLLTLWDAGLARLQPEFTAKFKANTLERLYEEHFGIFVGFSSFADKPAPYSGVGHFGGFPSFWNEDWCYLKGNTFSSDIRDVQQSLEKVPQSTGLDQWDAQFEAIMDGVLDPEMVWVPGTKKIIMLVTNSFGHSQALRTLADNVNLFNSDVVCLDGEITTGGFGAVDVPDRVGWVAPLNLQFENLYDLYNEYSLLLAEAICHPEKKDTDRDIRIAELKEKFEPTHVPDVANFDRKKLETDREAHCRENEYPAYEDVQSILNERNISLVVLYANANNKDTRAHSDQAVWAWALSSSEALGGTHNAIEVITATNLQDMPQLVSDVIFQITA